MPNNLFGCRAVPFGRVVGSESVVSGQPELLRLPGDCAVWHIQKFFVPGDGLVPFSRLLIGARNSLDAEGGRVLGVGKCEEFDRFISMSLSQCNLSLQKLQITSLLGTLGIGERGDETLHLFCFV